MSRAYEMHVEIENVSKDTVDTVIDACNDEWPFEEWHEDEESKKSRKGNIRLEAWGQSNLCGGEGEDDFSKRLKASIWKAAGKYVPVTVYATYLEDLPCESYESTEKEYEEWKKEDDDDRERSSGTDSSA